MRPTCKRKQLNCAEHMGHKTEACVQRSSSGRVEHTSGKRVCVCVSVCAHRSSVEGVEQKKQSAPHQSAGCRLGTRSLNTWGLNTWGLCAVPFLRPATKGPGTQQGTNQVQPASHKEAGEHALHAPSVRHKLWKVVPQHQVEASSENAQFKLPSSCTQAYTDLITPP